MTKANPMVTSKIDAFGSNSDRANKTETLISVLKASESMNQPSKNLNSSGCFPQLLIVVHTQEKKTFQKKGSNEWKYFVCRSCRKNILGLYLSASRDLKK